MMLVLDKSSSMNTNPAPSACTVMISSAQQFLTYFSPYDTIGLVSFDATADLDLAPTVNWGDGVLSGKIGAISWGSNTDTTAALDLAYQQIKNINLPVARNTIVLMTHGVPKGITANFPLRNYVDNRWGSLYTGTAYTPQPKRQYVRICS